MLCAMGRQGLRKTREQLGKHVTPYVSSLGQTSKGLLASAHSSVRSGVQSTFGDTIFKEEHKNAIFVKYMSYTVLTLPLLILLCFVRVIYKAFTYEKLVQFSHLYCLGFCIVMLLMEMLISKEPLSEFQIAYPDGTHAWCHCCFPAVTLAWSEARGTLVAAYIRFLFILAGMYCVYFIMLCLNICVTKCSFFALLQPVVVLGIAGHFYAAVFMRAMLGYAPLMDTREYAIYAVAFFSMSLLASSPPVDTRKEAQD
eukprot:scaffold4362_cov390-Prasinococcus_capsulatus_cf.AAC.5